MVRFAVASLCLIKLGSLTLLPVCAVQMAGDLTVGSVTVTLRRVNTINGSSNANPLYGTSAPGDDRLFLVQQGTNSPNPDIYGKVLSIDPSVVDGAVGILLDYNTALPGFLDIRHFEKGLLGLAFHPDFDNPLKPGYLKFYTYASELWAAHNGVVDFIHPETLANPSTTDRHVATLREWTANSTTPTSATPSRIVMTVVEPQNQHNGGTIAFGPTDGYLYWALGDGGGNSSTSPDFVGSIDSPTDGHTNSVTIGDVVLPHGNGQDRTTPLGSIMRINPLRVDDAPDPNAVPSANGEYQIPRDNPFTMESNIDPQTISPYPDWDADWVDEIYAYGLRNPYRFSFDQGNDLNDPSRGNLLLADAGWNDREEIDMIQPGRNYGWVIREGTEAMAGALGGLIPAYTPPVNAATGLPDELVDPVAEYHESIGSAVIGGFVYRGATGTDLAGKYVFGDYQSPLRGGNGILLYFDLNEEKQVDEPFTIYRLGINFRGPSLPAAALLGMGQGPQGELYAMFDNGQIYELVPTFLDGDFDRDGDVDGEDFLLWQRGESPDPLSTADLNRWKSNYGASFAVGAATAPIPEPVSLALVVLSLMPALLQRR